MGLKSRSRPDSTHDRVLQGDQCLGGLNFINCLDLVDKYLLQGVDGSTHNLNKDAVVAGGVIRFGHFVQSFRASPARMGSLSRFLK